MPDEPRHPMTRRRLHLAVPRMDDVEVQRDVAVGGVRDTCVDVYRLPDAPRHAACVVLVNGFSDEGAVARLGCRMKDMAAFETWARAFAAVGVVAVTHTTGATPADDLNHVIARLAVDGATGSVDPRRIGLWACSGHVPNAFGALIALPSHIQAAALCYGYMLDVDGADHVARARVSWRFAHPAAGASLDEVPDIPMLVVRAAHDATPGVNASIDAFSRAALARDRRLTLVNYPGPHAFDLEDDSPHAHAASWQVIDFLRRHLDAAAG